MDNFPKKKSVSFNFNGALLSLLYFLIFEDGTDRLPRDVSNELPLYAAYLKRAQISHDNFGMQALFWLCIVRGGGGFGPSSANLR
jgi:hypothetical protein